MAPQGLIIFTAVGLVGAGMGWGAPTSVAVVGGAGLGLITLLSLGASVILTR